MKKSITYCEAINEALMQEMERDESVFVYGIGVPDHTRIFGTINGIFEKFSKKRCFDTPLSEDALAGLGLGAAVGGLRPIYIHARVDFLLLAMNQIANMISSYRYCSGGKLSVPLVIRAIVGRGWGQGCQHSKTAYSMFAHIPGIKVIAPTTPSDAKGLLISAIRDNNPVICFEHRWLYYQSGDVEESALATPIGVGNIICNGTDLTIVATSWMNVEALEAASILKKRDISIEIIDPRTITPLDEDIIVNSVKKTKRCLVIDNDWGFCGFASEVASMVSNKCFYELEQPVQKITFAQTPCPTARHLENEFYPNAEVIIRKIEEMIGLPKSDLSNEKFYSYENKFKGPF